MNDTATGALFPPNPLKEMLDGPPMNRYFPPEDPAVILFTAYGTPVSQPRARACKRGRFASVYTPDGPVHAWRQDVRTVAVPLRPKVPLEAPVHVELAFVFARPAGHYRTNGQVKPRAPWEHGSKPDADNLAKALLDELTNVGYWKGDECVTKLTVTKLWGEPRDAGVRVEVRWGNAR